MVTVTHIEQYGNQFKLYYDDGFVQLAYPTQGALWIVTTDGEPGPGPDPGDGEYSWPYSLSVVTSEYGPRDGRFHEGMDFSGGAASAGNPIPAIGDGVVYSVDWGSGFGYHAIVKHGTFDGHDWYSLYPHMQTAAIVSPGQNVTKGQTIGPLGNSGASYGAHLHLEIHKTVIGGSLSWANTNPNYDAPRTAVNPRDFFTSYGDGSVIYP